jgi:hypothetical protein
MPDAAAPSDTGPLPPLPPQPEQPLPACKKTVMVAGAADLGAAIAAAVPGDCLVLADGTYTFPAYVTDDMDGQPRAKNDVGADEMIPGLVMRRPLTEADVGPASP